MYAYIYKYIYLMAQSATMWMPHLHIRTRAESGYCVMSQGTETQTWYWNSVRNQLHQWFSIDYIVENFNV